MLAIYIYNKQCSTTTKTIKLINHNKNTFISFEVQNKIQRVLLLMRYTLHHDLQIQSARILPCWQNVVQVIVQGEGIL